jgi:hypothetical protein
VEDMATGSITIQFNYIDTGIDTNTGRLSGSADTDGNIDTCGARAVTAATTFDPTTAVRREGKGKGCTSHPCHHKYNPQTAPFVRADLLIEGSLLALHVLCVRHGLVCLFFLVDLFVLRDILSWYSQAYSSKLRHEVLLRHTLLQQSQVCEKADQPLPCTLHNHSNNPHNLLRAACQIYDGPAHSHACLVSLNQKPASLAD